MKRPVDHSLPPGVTCAECAAVNWPSCGTSRESGFCVADDKGPFKDELIEHQAVLW